MIRVTEFNFNYNVSYKMKINNTLTPDENILALVKNSNPELKEGVVVGDAVHLDGVGPNNSAITLTPSVDGVYKTSEPVTVNYARRSIEEYIDVVSPIEVPLDTLDVEGHVVQQAMLFPASAHFFESIINEDAKNVLITPTTVASKLIFGDAAVNYTLQEAPVVGSEYVTIKFHTAGDVTSYRKMTALGLDDLPLEAVETPVMEGINSYTLTVGVDDIVKFKFDPITDLPPEMEGMLSELNRVNHGGLDITVMELPSTQDAPSLGQANNVIVEAVLPSVTTNLSGMFSDTTGTISGITGWDVSQVTSMGRMFNGCTQFNSDLSGWDVSNVTNMERMLYNCSNFNQDLSGWVVSAVTSMEQMFYNCPQFNSDISSWYVGEVTSMAGMFQGATSFNQDLSGWDVSQVTAMNNMFFNCSQFNPDVSGWNVSNVENMDNMFTGCSDFIQDISSWDVSKVTSMGWMFDGCVDFNSNVSTWNVSKVTNMDSMFGSCGKFNQDLSDWDVSQVTSMVRMFGNCIQFNSDLSGWDVSKVTNMEDMFNGARNFNGNVSTWNVSNVTVMTNMFYGCTQFNSDISTWDVSKVTDMTSMFEWCSNFNQDLSSWCVSNHPTLPVNFDNDTVAWVLPKPVWGTCPPRA